MTTSLTIALVLLGGLLATVAVIDLIHRKRDSGSLASNVLMRAAGLNRKDRRLLRHVARAADLPNAGCLLLSRGCFEHAARMANERGIDRSEISALQRRVDEAGEARRGTDHE